MADDIQDSNGQWLAADDLGDGRKIPRVKLAAGADGEAADISEENPLFVQVVSAGGAETDLSIVLYRVKTAFTGASIGDTVTATRAISIVSDTVTQVGSTLWRNESTDAVLASAPSAANLEAVGATGLTNAQLVAAGLMSETKGEAIRALLATQANYLDGLETLLGTATTGTASAPANATSTFTVLAANAARKGATITCEGAGCKVFLGSGASATVYTVALAVGDYFEVPARYTGIITGISTSATGNLRVTELT